MFALSKPELRRILAAVDLATAGRPQTIRAGEVPRFGDREGSNRLGFAIHIGSTVCASASPATPASPDGRRRKATSICATG